MDIDMALSISFRRLARRSIAGSALPQPKRGKPRPPRAAEATTPAAATAPEAALAALRRSLHVLTLARSRLRYALGISDALR